MTNGGKTIKDLNEYFLNEIESFVRQLFPKAVNKNTSFTIGNLDGDKGSSLTIYKNSGYWKDHATGDEGDLFELYCRANNLSKKEAFHELTNKKEINKYNSFKPNKNLQNKGVHYNKIIPIPADIKPPFGWSEYYPYHNDLGDLIFWILRKNKPEKFIRPAYWDFQTKKYIYKKPNMNKNPLMNLMKIHSEHKKVLVVEGEKCVSAAESVLSDEYTVTTWPFGCGSAQKADLSPLIGKSIILWPDNDKEGLIAMQKIYDLIRRGSSDILMVNCHNLKPKEDIADLVSSNRINRIRGLLRV